MTYLKLGGAALVALIIAFVAWSTWERFRLANVVAAQGRCVTATATADASLADCPAPIAARIEAARRAVQCDQGVTNDTVYAIRAACTEAVKHAVAARDAATSSLAEATATLRQATVERDAAVSRAEARVADFNQRISDHDRTIVAAPRLDDGRLHCDADCLRELAGDAAPAR